MITAPAMEFDDQKAADRNISALSAKPAIRSAALYAADGSLYASYSRAGAAPPPPRVPMTGEGAKLSGDRLEITRNIARTMSIWASST